MAMVIGQALAREAVAGRAETDWPHLRGGAYEALAEVLMAQGGRTTPALAAAGARAVRGEGERRGRRRTSQLGSDL